MNVSLRDLVPFIEELIADGKKVRLIARGSSMLPFILDGDIVEIDAVDNPIFVGDILLVRRPDGSYVLHRVVRVRDDKFYLRGDSGYSLEGPFSKVDVVGKAVACYRGRGKRVLAEGFWCLAGRLWVRLHPFPCLSFNFAFSLLRFLKVSVGFLLSRIQSLRCYRRLARLFSPRIDIREATEEDIYRLYSNQGGEIPSLNDEKRTVFVAKRGRMIVGSVNLYHHQPDDAPFLGYWVNSLYVSPLYRGLGIGEKLMMELLRKAKEKGAEEVFLFVNANNQPAIALHQKLGFKQVSLPQVEEYLQTNPDFQGRDFIIMCWRSNG